jgi:hypothetical protein
MAGEASRQQNDLAYMTRIMRHLPVYSLHD